LRYPPKVEAAGSSAPIPDLRGLAPERGSSTEAV
jgi:hypothetical protein